MLHPRMSLLGQHFQMAWCAQDSSRPKIPQVNIYEECIGGWCYHIASYTSASNALSPDAPIPILFLSKVPECSNRSSKCFGPVLM